LVVSGGHTDLVLILDHQKIKWLGGTRDDAAGECFDKCARLLGFGYPGGPAISQEAQKFDKKKINFAGIKDKDAITSQLISMRGVDINDVKNIESPSLFLKDIYHGKGIVEIGKLKSNKFTILIRTTKDFQKKLFLDNLKKLDKEGFLNFFYLQRFGTPRLINFSLGISYFKRRIRKSCFKLFVFSRRKRTPLFYKA